MINRPDYIDLIDEAFEVHPVCGILGPRQCGKTTLSKYYVQKNEIEVVHYFDLEDPTDLAKLESPKLTLGPLEGLIIIDEIQRRPELFPYLRVFVDTYPDRKLLILGSASRDLIQQSSETLAGRISYIELTPFSLSEVEDPLRLWKRGGFPRSYLSKTEKGSLRWRKEFIKTFLERDLSNIGIEISPYDMRRLWTMVAHYHGNIVNYSEIGRSLNISDSKARRYINLLQETFMVRLLKPWHANIKKRQVKSPKIYVRDSGLLHVLLDIDETNISMDPKVGASWEGYAIEEIIRSHGADPNSCYFWSTQQKAELDLLIHDHGKKYAYEFKYSSAPKIMPSMRISMEDLKLNELTVVIPGNELFMLSENIKVIGLEKLIAQRNSNE